MGFKIDRYYPPLTMSIENGNISCTDIFGSTWNGSTDTSVNLAPDNKDFNYDIKAYCETPEGAISISKNGLLLIYKNRRQPVGLYHKELYVTHKCQLDEALTKQRKYVHIGYYLSPSSILCVVLDLNTRMHLYLTESDGVLSRKYPHGFLIKPISVNVVLRPAYAYAVDLYQNYRRNEFVILDTKDNAVDISVLIEW